MDGIHQPPRNSPWMGKKRAKRVVAQTRTVRVFEEEELPSGGKIISKNKRRKKSVSKFTFYSPRASCEGFFFFFFSFSGKALFRRKHGATRRLSIPVERRPGQLLNKRVSGFNIGDFLHAQVPSHMVISRCVCVRARVCLQEPRLCRQQHTCGIRSRVRLDCHRVWKPGCCTERRERREGEARAEGEATGTERNYSPPTPRSPPAVCVCVEIIQVAEEGGGGGGGGRGVKKKGGGGKQNKLSRLFADVPRYFRGRWERRGRQAGRQAAPRCGSQSVVRKPTEVCGGGSRSSQAKYGIFTGKCSPDRVLISPATPRPPPDQTWLHNCVKP